MASILPSVPRGTFALTSKQLQRHASTVPAITNATHQLNLFKPPSSIIKPWKVITGTQEWQTSTYHYNKQTQKTLPTAANTADKLLRDYATMIKSRGLGSTGSSSTARSAVAARRRNFEKMYVSGTTTKDYGDRVVVKAYMFDAVEAEAEEKKRRMAEMKERSAARRKGGASKGAGGRRRAPGAGGAGGTGGVRRFPPGAGAGAGAGARSGAAGAGVRRFTPGVGFQRAGGAPRAAPSQ